MDINAKIANLRTWVATQLLNVVDWAPGALASNDGQSDAVEGLPTDDGYQSDTRRVQHAGFRSRFAKTIGNVIVKRGSRWFAVAEDDGASISLNDGEAIVYSPAHPDAYVKLDKDGAITATNASGVSIVLDKNGGATVTTAAGQPVTLNAGAGANVAINAGAAGSVVVNSGTRSVAAQGDTAGPYPITATIPTFKTL